MGVFEITQLTRAKLELAGNEEFNPIKQDIKKNKQTGDPYLREYAVDPPFNYGFLPMTWESNQNQDKETSCFGDNDPVDIVELSGKPLIPGAYCRLKILGALCLIDQGELDWKLFCIQAEEGKRQKIRTMNDIQESRVNEIREWFRTIKTYDGKPENEFGYGGNVLNAEKALEVIEKHSNEYQSLIKGDIPNKDRFWLK